MFALIRPSNERVWQVDFEPRRTREDAMGQMLQFSCSHCGESASYLLGVGMSGYPEPQLSHRLRRRYERTSRKDLRPSSDMPR